MVLQLPACLLPLRAPHPLLCSLNTTFPHSSCFGSGVTFSLPSLFLSRGLKFSKVTPGALGFEIVTLSDAEASGKVAQPFKAAVAMTLPPVGSASEMGGERGEHSVAGSGPSRFMVCLSLSHTVFIPRGLSATLVTCRDWH